MASGAALVGRKLGRYRVVEQIGAGGMGVVYRAHDDDLKRDVAIKVLPSDTAADSTARARLLQEARSAAALNHAHICTVHEVGEADGLVFIAMEWVIGQTLSDRLAKGPLDAAQVLKYGIQLSDALAHAHSRGIVHRDLKSANIVITAEGSVKVLDFGLAKKMPEQDLEAVTRSEESLTITGAICGTLAYMSPEQLRGQQADVRSDIWAIGVVLHEMASGKTPFIGSTGYELSSAILGHQPAPLPRELPLGLRAVVERCLEKDAARRYQHAAEVCGALRSVEAGHTSAIVWKSGSARRRMAIALAVVVLLAVIAVLALRRVRNAGGQKIESLAVLPFENLSGSADQDYLADGIQDALITDLAKLHGLRRVSARASVNKYRKTDKSPSQIARELGVDAVVTGAVVRSGESLRVTTQLIRGSTEQTLWAERYDEQLRDLLALQGKLLTAITHEIRVQLTPAEQQRLAEARTVNPEAYDAYLQGRFYRLRRDVDTSERYFRLALQKDPNYSAAHAGLGTIWYERADLGQMSPREVMPRAKEELQTALRLDDTNGEAHYWLAIVSWTYEWDWSEGERQFRRAIELTPNDAEAHFQYADFLVTMKRAAEWQREIDRTADLDPPNTFFQVFTGWHLLYLHRDDEGIAKCRGTLVVEPNNSSAHLCLWGGYYRKAQLDNALGAAKKFFAVIKDQEAVNALELGAKEGGYRAAMRRAGDVLAERSKSQYVSGMRIARLYAHAAENDRAMEWLEKAYGRREVNLIHINVGWDWDGLRADARFQDLLRRMKFPN